LIGGTLTRGQERKGELEGEEGEEGRGVQGKRRSKDWIMNKEGGLMLDFLGEEGWCIFNGNTKGDEEGEYTYTGGRGCTVIDYVIGEGEVKDRVERMRIGDRVDSDHQPVEVWLKGERVRGEGAK